MDKKICFYELSILIMHLQNAVLRKSSFKADAVTFIKDCYKRDSIIFKTGLILKSNNNSSPISTFSYAMPVLNSSFYEFKILPTSIVDFDFFYFLFVFYFI